MIQRDNPYERTSMSGRDYLEEMNEIINQHVGDTEYPQRKVADTIVDELYRNNPELLMAWLMAHSRPLMWKTIADRARHLRARNTALSRRAAIRETLDAHAAGDPTALCDWLNTPFTVGKVSKPLGKMDRADLQTTAAMYRKHADGNRLKENVLVALAEQLIDGQLVQDRYTNEQISDMFGRMGPQD